MKTKKFFCTIAFSGDPLYLFDCVLQNCPHFVENKLTKKENCEHWKEVETKIEDLLWD